MQLTSFTDFSLRALIYLGIHPDHLATISEIAAEYHVPRNHLMKVVHRLATLGYVETIRGNGGGMRLARIPSLISVGAVVRDVEEKLDVLDCFNFRSKDVDCPLLPGCALRSVLMQARDNFLSTLDGVTLDELLMTGKTQKLVWPTKAVHHPSKPASYNNNKPTRS